jgi:hypothetical protein
MFSRAAVLCALCAMASIVTGALVTNRHVEFGTMHTVLGVAATGLGAAFAASKRPEVRRCGIAVCVTGAVECMLRGQVPALHALLAPLVFSAGFAGMKPLAGDDSAGLRRPVLACPVLVLVQIALGAAYRHKLTEVLPHMAGAMLIAGYLLIVCALVLQQHAAPRTAAKALLAIVLLQVSLGTAAFLMRLLELDGHGAFEVLSVAHVCTGSLTLAASLVLALQFPAAGSK